MRILFLVAAVFAPICAAATCTLPVGPVILRKEIFNVDKKIVLGCIDGEIEFVALESGSTYSWVSMGKVNAPISPEAGVSIHVTSAIIFPNDTWASISSASALGGQGPMASLNLREYAKIEHGIVTDIVSAKRGAAFPANATWVVTPYDPSRGCGRISRGYRYKRRQFFPPVGSSGNPCK